jgi:predicted DsbA family dithiol-disulfide isomerase
MRPRLREVCIAGAFAVLSVGLLGASCDKKSSATPVEPTEKGDKKETASGPNVPFEAPRTPASSGTPVSTTTAPAQTSAAPAAPAAAPPGDPAQIRFTQIADHLSSPCGKAQSLAKSLSSDPTCKRNPFARRLLEKLIKADMAEDEIKEIYDLRFARREVHRFNLADTPHQGSPSAPVVLVEFFDYGCPHCKATLPVLEDVASSWPQDAVIYFKHFPIHKDAPMAARAAVAAQKQGKFQEMHRKLFANQSSFGREDLVRYAKEIGLDVNRFQADLDDPATSAKVAADRAEGEQAKLQGTPTIYVDGRMYAGAYTADDLGDWIAEEKAVR